MNFQENQDLMGTSMIKRAFLIPNSLEDYILRLSNELFS